MAFISAENAREIRKALKEKFPEYKFSVRIDRHTAVNVTILSGPVSFDDILGKNELHRDYVQINEYHLYQYGKHETLFKKILDTIKYASSRKWFDESDSSIDYFHTAFYIYLNVGSYEKPYTQKK